MIASQERAPNRPVALVGADLESAASALQADLRSLRYDVVPLQLDKTGDHPPASLAVLATAGALAACARASEEIRGSADGVPILWVVDPLDLAALERHEGLFDDFVGFPYTTPELDARLRRLRRAAGEAESEALRIGRLEMDLASYRAIVDGRPLKLTFMEYELLRYLAARPGRIHTREAILRGVWGYDYYGGMRTVDVHVRRLRAKLGQEHGRMIETVRGVGYGLTDRLEGRLSP
ncbi:MAG TPA: winged helix-turn-helix domain-containing protein [Actinomycetota bacterium]|jgi:DNA-binding response OmpR family regulator|nr:winged helix-turn-helix domain-containing protein [Actinomycetota bacterium]